jgi:hypothetical protein
MQYHYAPNNGQRDDRETEDMVNVAGVEAGRYEKDPDLDLARVGDDTVMPNRELL